MSDRKRATSGPDKKCDLWGCGRAARHVWRIQGVGDDAPKAVEVCDYHDDMMKKAA